MSLRADIAGIGSRVLDSVDATVELWRVLVSTLSGATHRYWRGTRPAGELARPRSVGGNKSLVVVAVTHGGIGRVLVYQTCLRTTQVVDGRGQVGQQWARLLVLDVGPSLTAMMLATRVGAGIAAEIGSMKVTEQIDALRMSGVNPIDYLIVPRFFACILMCVVLSMFGMAVAWGTGGLTGYYSFQINPRIFFDMSMVEPSHMAMGLIKAFAFGMAIPVVSGFCGLRARGSSEGVGWATTAAVIGSSFAVLVLDFLISTVGLVAFGVGL
jgi:phospholipid/cholesterol/gamma-HCH transport system permease protein